eukprot:CAMPEP_0203674640 /NCGR_PEP_ID=MMETSP0090-20130426/16801_1 /ASSEMBLY_ACC=CAM_ASM_001088 /TAXON_ID=426623 /ORGANISM="Chaetoceros affinis, Strain CCMP159" /LENGTH=344 /DNA_ID=CAMNT_0050540577 /DNA_START=72 /DNA_END=1106 /DNA_ORIENTATION=+
MTTIPLFDIAISTIFAREVLEATIVIGQYRTVLLRSESPEWQDPEEKKRGLRAINHAAIVSALIAFIMILAVAIPLLVVSQQLSKELIQIVEGTSKVVAAICITQLSLKIPRLLGFYPSKKRNGGIAPMLSIRNIRFNVGWNIWREVAETGAYLLPYFLAGHLRSIPVSAISGTFIGFATGISVYIANKRQSNMLGLAVFMAVLTGQLAIGLFTGGCNEFEKALGETKTVWTIEAKFWDHNRLPMTIFKPFGYTSSRTVLQIIAYWSYTALTVILHLRKYRQAKAIQREIEEEGEEEEKEGENKIFIDMEIGDEIGKKQNTQHNKKQGEQSTSNESEVSSEFQK